MKPEGVPERQETNAMLEMVVDSPRVELMNKEASILFSGTPQELWGFVRDADLGVLNAMGSIRVPGGEDLVRFGSEDGPGTIGENAVPQFFQDLGVLVDRPPKAPHVPREEAPRQLEAARPISSSPFRITEKDRVPHQPLAFSESRERAELIEKVYQSGRASVCIYFPEETSSELARKVGPRMRGAGFPGQQTLRDNKTEFAQIPLPSAKSLLIEDRTMIRTDADLIDVVREAHVDTVVLIQRAQQSKYVEKDVDVSVPQRLFGFVPLPSKTITKRERKYAGQGDVTLGELGFVQDGAPDNRPAYYVGYYKPLTGRRDAWIDFMNRPTGINMDATLVLPQEVALQIEQAVAKDPSLMQAILKKFFPEYIGEFYEHRDYYTKDQAVALAPEGASIFTRKDDIHAPGGKGVISGIKLEYIQRAKK